MTLEQIAENHGLTPEGVDFALRQYQIVVSEITHGRLSKPTYDAEYILQTAQERWCDTCDLKEPVVPTRRTAEVEDSDKEVTIWFCGECEKWIANTYSYCPWCGKKVDWDA